MAPSSPKTIVLVVEDDRGTRELYRHALIAAGFAVVAVEDGLDALRSIERQIPDVLVLDLALPRLSGRNVRRELGSHVETSGIPIVVVTGTDVNERDAAGFACVLRKPIHTEELILAVDRCLRGARRRSEL